VKRFKIKDLMVPLTEYAVIAEDASLFEAVKELEKAQEEFDTTRYRHRAMLVKNREGKIVGKLSQHDVLRALEPKYMEMKSETHQMAKLGFSKKFLLSMLENYKLFDKPLDDICKKAGQEKVIKFMHRPSDGEYIDENASLDEAIHLLIAGHHQSLLVTRGEAIIGILRLSDVFAAVFHTMKACNL
jgi:CBS domain-containing protein